MAAAAVAATAADGVEALGTGPARRLVAETDHRAVAVVGYRRAVAAGSPAGLLSDLHTATNSETDSGPHRAISGADSAGRVGAGRGAAGVPGCACGRSGSGTRSPPVLPGAACAGLGSVTGGRSARGAASSGFFSAAGSGCSPSLPSASCSSLPAISDIWPTCCIALCTPCMMPCGIAAAMPIICMGIWAACCAICIGMPIICPAGPPAAQPRPPVNRPRQPRPQRRRPCPRAARAIRCRIELTQTPQDLLGKLAVGAVVGPRGVEHVLCIPVSSSLVTGSAAIAGSTTSATLPAIAIDSGSAPGGLNPAGGGGIALARASSLPPAAATSGVSIRSGSVIATPPCLDNRQPTRAKTPQHTSAVPLLASLRRMLPDQQHGLPHNFGWSARRIRSVKRAIGFTRRTSRIRRLTPLA